jgi:UDP-glucose 4-epimerase
MVLVTGAGGFIGKKIVETLKEMGESVISLYHAKSPEAKNEGIYLDLVEKKHFELFDSLPSIPETVIHLAGVIDISLKHDSRKNRPVPGEQDISKIYKNNILSTINMIDFCLQKKVKKLILASSQTVYGLPENGEVTEMTKCNPIEHYAASKLCCEEILKVASKQGLQVFIARFPGVYGEERQSGVVYNLCKAALENDKVEINPETQIPFDIIHIEDLVDAFMKMVHAKQDKEWNCYNISSGEPFSLEILAKKISSLVPGCNYLNNGIEQPVIIMSSSSAKKELFWQPISISVRLKNMLESIKTEILKSK